MFTAGHIYIPGREGLQSPAALLRCYWIARNESRLRSCRRNTSIACNDVYVALSLACSHKIVCLSEAPLEFETLAPTEIQNPRAASRRVYSQTRIGTTA